MSFTGIMQDLFKSNILNYQGEMIEWIIGIFEKFLVSKKISANTRKNYRSDIRNFITWIVETRKILFSPDNFNTQTRGFCQMIDLQTVENFKQTELEKRIPPSTINRRLSSLRIFLDCAQNNNWVNSNINASIKNITLVKNEISPEVIIQEFVTHLQNEGASKGTIKNYTTDVHDFLIWMNKQTNPTE